MAPPRIFYPDTPELPLPEKHRFPISKYRLLRERIVAERLLARSQLVPSPPASLRELQLAHDTGYVESVLAGTLSASAQRIIGLPWSATLVRRSRATVGGSLAAGREALAFGISGQLAGGTHHAHREFGSGYCVFNDLAVAALAMLEEASVRRVAILDVDVHQGDGNASILQGHSGTFVVSIHGEKNFPFTKAQSDLDIALPDGTADEGYLDAVSTGLEAAIGCQPDLLFYLAGVDPLDVDSLGRLAVTAQGLRQRDEMVFEACRAAGLPIAVVAGGGYANPIRATVDAYAATWAAAARVFRL
jgi:acetoin utilization deacetylase AcuC-like enzyme